MPDPQTARSDPTAPESSGFEDVAARSFAVVRRGFDQDAVRGYLRELAASLGQLGRREVELRSLLEDAERRAASPVLDEETLSAAVGSETAKVLHTAHEAAREVVARAEARAADLLADAGAVLGERQREAEAEARALTARSRAEAAALAEATKAECRAMVEEAREARRRILGDLAGRRRTLHVQLEQLRAGKDALAQVIDATVRSVDEVRGRLVDSEAEARLAAERAAQVASFEHDDMSLDALVEESFALLGPSEPSLDLDEVDGTEADPELLAGPQTTSYEPATSGDGGSRPDRDDGPIPSEMIGEISDGSGGDAPDPEPSADAEPPAGAVGSQDEATQVAANVDASLSGEDVVSGGATAGGPATAGSPGGPTAAVDDLFARIRAASGDGEPAPQPPHEAGRSSEGDSESRDAPHAGAKDREPGTTGAVGAQLVGGAIGDEEAELAAPRLDADEQALALRDELLAPVLSDLARILKRELRSDQNELLDSLRGLQRGAEAGELVPGEATMARLATATAPALTAAWRSGIAFAGPAGAGGRRDPGSEPTKAANELATEVVASLRQRLDGALTVVEEDGATAEHVGAAYRQWRGERVEDLVGHYATRCFSLGVLAGAASGSLVRWVVDDGKDHCPDCDDNALAGSLHVGEMFPTGQAHPPVHPGCRCALVPSSS